MSKKRMLHQALIFLLCCAIFSPFAAYADEDGRKTVFDLGEVVVTDRSETITQVGSVETVGLEDIELTNSRNIADAINIVPGVSISTGGRKAESAINVRGFGNRYVPIFYDGIPLYIPYDGYVDAGNLTTDNVSRIDISKGVSSVLYGFNTMGGVINIVSQKPHEKFEGSYRLEYAEVDNANGSFNIGSNRGKYYFTVGGGFTDSNGWPLSDDFTPTSEENGGNRENADLEDWNASFKVGITPAPGHEYALGYQTIQKEKGLPPSTDSAKSKVKNWRFSDWEKQTFYFIGNTKVTQNLSLKTRLFRDEYYNTLVNYTDETYTTSTWHSTFDDHSYGGSLVARTTYIPKNTLSASFHYKYDVHESQGDIGDPWGKHEQAMYAFGLEDDIKLMNNLAVVVGLGYEIQDPQKSFNGTTNGSVRESESTLNPQIGVLWTIFNDLDLHFSVGKKTRWPTLNELYSDGLDNDVKPNPDLEEEESINYELGFKKPLPRNNSVGLTFFYSDVKDMIEKVTITDPTYDEQQQNINDSRFRGIEFQFTSKWIPDNTFQFHYTYTDAKNKSANAASENLDGIPEHKLYFSDHYAITDMFSVFASAEYNAGRYDEDAKRVQRKVDTYWVADFKVMAHLNPLLNLEIGVTNLFDEDYEMEFGYPLPGRSFFIGISGKF